MGTRAPRRIAALLAAMVIVSALVISSILALRIGMAWHDFKEYAFAPYQSCINTRAAGDGELLIWSTVEGLVPRLFSPVHLDIQVSLPGGIMIMRALQEDQGGWTTSPKRSA